MNNPRGVATIANYSSQKRYESYLTLDLMETSGSTGKEPPNAFRLLLAYKFSQGTSESKDWVREVFFGKSVLLLFGGLLIGLLTGAEGYVRVEPFFGGLFTGVLALFLLEMGVLAGRRLPDVRTAGWGLIGFAIAFPMFSGVLGIVSGYLAGLSMGGAMILGVLCASASYIAAPAAVRLALPQANPGVTLTSSLGITFPFNLILGIPIYFLIAQSLEGLLR